jgi:hypothetical protein
MFLQALLSAIIEKAWFRWLAAVLIIALGTFAIMTPQERAMVAARAISWHWLWDPAHRGPHWARQGDLSPFEKPSLSRRLAREGRL